MPTVLREDFNTNDGGWSANADAQSFSYIPVSGADGGYVEGVDDARDSMALFTGSTASALAARAEMDADYAKALDPVNGEFLMPLVGVVDDPFAA